ncbi:MAG: penicillin-binding transpeptidase domain-containing protein [Christensenellales bacterium]
MGAIVLFFLLLIFRLAQVQLFQGTILQDKAIAQWTRDLTVKPNRGVITDTNGKVLAQSAMAYTVVVNPADVADPDLVGQKLGEILDMDPAGIAQKASDKSKSEIWIKRQISDEQAEQIKALNLKGVGFYEDTKRYYPANTLACQVLGYTNADGVGQAGLEKQYETYLQGVEGRLISTVDAHNQELPNGNEWYVPAQDGYQMTLTLDAVIQSFAENALENVMAETNAKDASVVVMRPKTGQVVAMAGNPNMDLNDLPRSDSALLSSLSRNRTVSDAYEPGSVFKIVTLASGLDSGAVSTESTFDCTGYYTVDGEKIKCWRSGNPHGHQTLAEGVKNSCNPVFMQIALKMGSEKFYDYLDAFGLGQPTGLDFPGESSGIVTEQKYVRNTDLARIGFGQSIAVTPIQMANAVCAAVNGGNLMQPYLVEKLTDADGNVVESFEPTVKQRVVSEQTSQTVREILELVVSEGSGKNAQVPGYRVGGKTGTAQKYDSNGNIKQGKHIASFVGIAPINDPELVVLVVVDEPEVAVDFGSVIAAPVAQQILESSLHYLGIQPTEAVAEQTAQVPSVVGQSIGDAVDALTQAGFKVDALAETGVVTAQYPKADTQSVQGATVILSTDQQTQDAAEQVEVPDLTGCSIVEANTRLNQQGLMLRIDGSGLATGQSVAPGTQVDVGTVVEVHFE